MHTSFTRPAATGEQFIPALPERNGAIGLLIGVLCRLHDLGLSSDRHIGYLLFDQVTFLQGLEEFAHVVLRKVPANAELPADLIDDP